MNLVECYRDVPSDFRECFLNQSEKILRSPLLLETKPRLGFFELFTDPREVLSGKSAGVSEAPLKSVLSSPSAYGEVKMQSE